MDFEQRARRPRQPAADAARLRQRRPPASQRRGQRGAGQRGHVARRPDAADLRAGHRASARPCPATLALDARRAAELRRAHAGRRARVHGEPRPRRSRAPPATRRSTVDDPGDGLGPTAPSRSRAAAGRDRARGRGAGRCPTARSAITFTQAIAADEPLRTGAYSRTLVFTLSTTNPGRTDPLNLKRDRPSLGSRGRSRGVGRRQRERHRRRVVAGTQRVRWREIGCLKPIVTVSLDTGALQLDLRERRPERLGRRERAVGQVAGRTRSAPRRPPWRSRWRSWTRVLLRHARRERAERGRSAERQRQRRRDGAADAARSCDAPMEKCVEPAADVEHGAAALLAEIARRARADADVVDAAPGSGSRPSP